MFDLRILSGPTAGKKIELKAGRSIIGRGESCDIQIQSNGVSKEHCEIQIFNDRVVIKDLGSSNGTFLNGVKIQTGILRAGDKFSVYDIVMELLPHADKKPAVPKRTSPLVRANSYPQQMPMSNGNAAYQAYPQMQQAPPQQQAQMSAAPEAPPMNFQARMEYFVNEVLLPGVYKLSEFIPVKYVIAMLVLAFVFAVTTLSVIPMMTVTQDAIFVESRRRALSVARTIAQANQQALVQGNFMSLSTQSAETEEGVKQAFIVQQADGLIVAPATMAGHTSPMPFVHKVRREMKSLAEMQDDGHSLVASFPIGQYDPNTGEPSIKAHVIVVYDVTSMSFDSGRVVSLFMQIGIIASLLGMVLFFLIYQLVENPIRVLNIELDQAMREKNEHIETPYDFPVLHALTGNISSLLAQAFNPVQTSTAPVGGSKESDLDRMVDLFGSPVVIVRASGSILGANNAFAELARTQAHLLKDQTLQAIQDGALQQNIDYLVGKSKEVPYSIHQDQLDFSGTIYELKCSAVIENNHPVYFIVSAIPTGGGS